MNEFTKGRISCFVIGIPFLFMGVFMELERIFGIYKGYVNSRTMNFIIVGMGIFLIFVGTRTGDKKDD